MLRVLLENARDKLAEVPELIGSDSPACHRVKIAHSNITEALGILQQQETAPAPAPAPAAPGDGQPAP